MCHLLLGKYQYKGIFEVWLFLTGSINKYMYLGQCIFKGNKIHSYGRIDQFQRVSPACFSYILIFELRVKYKDGIQIPQSHPPEKKAELCTCFYSL